MSCGTRASKNVARTASLASRSRRRPPASRASTSHPPPPPAVEVPPADDVLRSPRVEERRPHRLAREQVAPPRSRLERLDLLHTTLVLAHERVVLVPIALDEPAAV